MLYPTNVDCRTLKTYYQREQFARYNVEGKSSHMFMKMGTKCQVVIINHHQNPVKTAGCLDPSPHGNRPTSQHVCLQEIEQSFFSSASRFPTSQVNTAFNCQHLTTLPLSGHTHFHYVHYYSIWLV